MKAATLQKTNPFPDNIIVFPKRPSRKVGATRKPTTRVSLADGIEANKSSATNIRRFPSPLTDSARGLVADTCGILAKRFEVYGALAIPNMDFARLAYSRRLTPQSSVRVGSLKGVLSAAEDFQPDVS